EPAAVAVDAVAAEPLAEHVPLLLEGVHGVDAGGLQVGAAAVAPGAVGAGVGGAVLAAAPDAGTLRVAHRRRLGAEVDGSVVVALVVGRGGVADLVPGLDDLAGLRVHVHVQLRRRVLVEAADDGLVDEASLALGHDHQLGRGRALGVGHLGAGRLRRLRCRDVGVGGDVQFTCLAEGRAQHRAVRVGRDDEVAAVHGETVVQAVVGDVLEAAERGGDAAADDLLFGGLLELRGLRRDQAVGRGGGDGAGVGGGRGRVGGGGGGGACGRTGGGDGQRHGEADGQRRRPERGLVSHGGCSFHVPGRAGHVEVLVGALRGAAARPAGGEVGDSSG